MLKWVALLSMLTIFGCSNNDQTNIKDQVIAASVQIGDYCSGTVIESDDTDGDGIYTTKVLTAKHCFMNQEETEYLPVGTTIPVYLPIYDDGVRQDTPSYAFFIDKYSDGDLALLVMHNSNVQFKSVPVATKEVLEHLHFGDQVMNISFPGIIEQFYNEGFLGHKMKGFGDRIYQSADITIMQGSSGSSLVAIYNGTPYVIGVLTSGIFGKNELESYITQWSTTEDIIDFVGE